MQQSFQYICNVVSVNSYFYNIFYFLLFVIYSFVFFMLKLFLEKFPSLVLYMSLIAVRHS